MKRFLLLSLLACSALAAAQPAAPQPAPASAPPAQIIPTDIPRLVERNGRFQLLVDGEPYFVLGAQAGNSSNWPAVLPKVWESIKNLHANTLEIPVYWEEIEPVKGRYDFKSVQLLLDQARQNDVRLVLLWFATWKNGSNHYMPEWMKLDSKKYCNITGLDGKPVDSPSPHCAAAMEADAKAFAAFMQYLRDNDPCHTVIMVQVQNEPGSWGSIRDYSPQAQKLFRQSVPSCLLAPSVLRELKVPVVTAGTWSEVFGDRADEFFQAWSVAGYIEYVAAAGKAVNPLPMYVNVALRNPFGNPPATSYESGGATDNVIAIYKAAAPHIDFVAPDIYLDGDANHDKVFELYARSDNALMVPETGPGSSKYVYEVVEKGIGFAPFGVDIGRLGAGCSLSGDYALLKPIAGKIARWSFEGRVFASYEPEDRSDQRLNLGAWDAVLIYGQPMISGNAIPGPNAPAYDRPSRGKALLVKLDEGDFLVIGNDVRFTFRPSGRNEGRPWGYLRVEEGRYNEVGEWEMKRVLNGDETDWSGPYVGSEATMLRIRVYTR